MGRKMIYLDDAIEAIEEITWYHQNRNNEMVSGANSSEHQAWYKSDDVYKALEDVPEVQDVIHITSRRKFVPNFDFDDVEPEQQWIPASERLPELGQLVLVTSAINGDIHLCTQCATDGQMFIMKGTRYHVFGEAWMPVPEPYKGVQE